jgi:hypothetical protein
LPRIASDVEVLDRICDDAAMARLPARQRARRAWLTVALALPLLAACGGDDGAGACGGITREALDPAYLVHVLGTDADVEYSSDPPTSGPHQPAPPVEGVAEDPIPRPIQVGILERGDVLVQYDPALEAGERVQLEALAGDGVVVAPNAELPDPIVATAWLHKRTCDAVDVDALEDFVEERRGKGPDA